MWSLHPANQGFTLIELLVTTTLSMILIGGGIVSYNTFLERQARVQAGQEFISVVREAQQRARNGDKPSTGCTTLNGYRVWGTANGTQYFMALRCNGVATDLETATYTLPAGELIRTTFSLLFPVFPGPVQGAPATVAVIKSGATGGVPRYEFQVSQQGIIQNIQNYP